MSPSSAASSPRVGSPQQTLSRIQALTQRALRERPAREELQRARDEFVHQLMASLGGLNACLCVVAAPAGNLSSDAVYAHSLIARHGTLAALVHGSVLSSFDTARALHELLESRCVVAEKSASHAS